MKNFLVMMMVAFGATAFANDVPRIAVVPFQEKDVYKVIYKGNEAGKVRLNILTTNGSVVHTETIRGLDGFIRPFNFKGLDAGEYTIEVLDGTSRFVETVNHAPAEDLKSIHIGRIVEEPGKYLLAVANAGNESIHVKIYDRAFRVIHAESHVLAGDFAQVYTIKEAGRYTFEVTDEKGATKYFWF